jgi:serine protease Do
MQLVADARTGTQQLLMTALQHALPRGAAIFSLDGSFVGLVRDGRDPATVLTAEFLRAAADGAQPSPTLTRGSLGIQVETLTPALARATGAARGVIVTHLAIGGPAAKVLQSGDVIQSLDGTPISTIAEFRQQEAGRAPGASIALTGLRRGSALEATVVVADAAAAPAAAPTAGPGFVGRSVPGAGIEVVTVSEGSAATLAGLEPGDLIVALDGQTDPDVAGLTRRYRAADAGASLLLTVRRGQRHHVFALEKR